MSMLAVPLFEIVRRDEIVVAVQLLGNEGRKDKSFYSHGIMTKILSEEKY